MRKLALILLAAVPLFAQFDRSKFEIPHHKFVLENGLTVLVHEDHSVPVVAVNVWYHVGSRNEKRGKTGFAHMLQTDKTRESIVELIKELRGVAGERPLAGEELASVMRSQTLSLPGRFGSLAALDAAALSIINYGYPDGYYGSYARNVRALTEGQLNAAGKKVVRPEEIVWVIVGDLKKIEAGVRELNLGDVERYSGEM